VAKTILAIVIFVLIICLTITILFAFDYLIIRHVIELKNDLNRNKPQSPLKIEKEYGPNGTWSYCGLAAIKPNIKPEKLSRQMSKRIIGGETAIQNSWPFLVSIRITLNKSEHHCGGSLITDQFILTAAHCLLPYFKIARARNMSFSDINTLFEVYVGIHDHDSSPLSEDIGEVHAVESFDFHEKFTFNRHTLNNDIAILKLKTKINIKKPEINVVCIPDSRRTNHQYEVIF
jgi:hypothetical protein